MLKYSNGWGHFIMSIFLTLVGLALILIPGINPGATGVGIGLILAVQAAWFVPGAAKQVAHEMINQMQALPAPAAGTTVVTTTPSVTQVTTTPVDPNSTQPHLAVHPE